MELTGEKVVNASQVRVYDALHDPVILRQAIPGVQTLTKQGDGRFIITASVKVGPLRPSFTGTIDVYNEDRPSGYSLRGEAGGGGGGSVGGNAHVALAAIDVDTTNLAFHVTADLAGQIASIEGLKLDVTARALIAEFFSRLQSLLDGEELDAFAAPGEPAAAVAEAQFEASRAAAYQPPRYPPHSNYPDFETRDDDMVGRQEGASTTDATGGLVLGSQVAGSSVAGSSVLGAADQGNEPAPTSLRHPGTLPQTPYHPSYRLGYEAADTVVYNGSGSGIGRWLMAIVGLCLIALLLNGGFSGVNF